jgi:hypothetical protein
VCKDLFRIADSRWSIQCFISATPIFNLAQLQTHAFYSTIQDVETDERKITLTVNKAARTALVMDSMAHVSNNHDSALSVEKG